jgi:hypothetical protein
MFLKATKIVPISTQNTFLMSKTICGETLITSNYKRMCTTRNIMNKLLCHFVALSSWFSQLEDFESTRARLLNNWSLRKVICISRQRSHKETTETEYYRSVSPLCYQQTSVKRTKFVGWFWTLIITEYLAVGFSSQLAAEGGPEEKRKGFTRPQPCGMPEGLFLVSKEGNQRTGMRLQFDPILVTNVPVSPSFTAVQLETER